MFGCVWDRTAMSSAKSKSSSCLMKVHCSPPGLTGDSIHVLVDHYQWRKKKTQGNTCGDSEGRWKVRSVDYSADRILVISDDFDYFFLQWRSVLLSSKWWLCRSGRRLCGSLWSLHIRVIGTAKRLSLALRSVYVYWYHACSSLIMVSKGYQMDYSCQTLAV